MAINHSNFETKSDHEMVPIGYGLGLTETKSNLDNLTIKIDSHLNTNTESKRKTEEHNIPQITNSTSNELFLVATEANNTKKEDIEYPLESDLYPQLETLGLRANRWRIAEFNSAIAANGIVLKEYNGLLVKLEDYRDNPFKYKCCRNDKCCSSYPICCVCANPCSDNDSRSKYLCKFTTPCITDLGSFKLQDLFKRLKPILEANRHLIKLILVGTNHFDRIELPIDWEEQFYHFSKGTSLIALELRNLRSRITSSTQYADLSNMKMYDHLHRDLNRFSKTLHEQGFESLDFGDTPLHSSLPITQYETRVCLPNATMATIGCCLNIICCPCACILCCLHKPFFHDSVMDMVNETELRKITQDNLEFLAHFIVQNLSFSEFTADFSNMLKYIARVVNKKNFKNLTENNAPQIVDLNPAAKILQVHQSTAKIKLLHINNLDLGFAVPDSKIYFLEALFGIGTLRALNFARCNIFNQKTTLLEIRSIAALAARSNAEMICGLGLEMVTPESLGVFIRAFIDNVTTDPAVLKMDSEAIQVKARLPRMKTIGICNVVINSNQNFDPDSLGRCEIIIGESRIRWIGLNAFSSAHKMAFFGEILKTKAKLKALYLYNVELFFGNNSPVTVTILNHNEMVQLMQMIKESGIERVAFWGNLYRLYEPSFYNFNTVEQHKKLLAGITEIYKILDQNPHLLGTDIIEDVYYNVLGSGDNFAYILKEMHKESKEFGFACQALIKKIEMNWNNKITNEIIQAQPILPRPVALLTAQYVGYRKNHNSNKIFNIDPVLLIQEINETTSLSKAS